MPNPGDKKVEPDLDAIRSNLWNDHITQSSYATEGDEKYREI